MAPYRNSEARTIGKMMSPSKKKNSVTRFLFVCFHFFFSLSSSVSFAPRSSAHAAAGDARCPFAHHPQRILAFRFVPQMPPRRGAAAAAAAPASAVDDDLQSPFDDAEALVRSAAETARRRLAALVAAARRVLAALAADPSAVETGARVEIDDDVDDSKMMVDEHGGKTSTSTPPPPKPLVRALSESVEDLLAARAALRASVEELQAAESLSASIPEPAREGAAEAASLRSRLADALEPRVAALRAAVEGKNSAVAAMADSLAALVSDVDSWRVAGPGAWPAESEAEE